MADPFRIVTQWPGLRGRVGGSGETSGWVTRHNGLQRAAFLIEKHELSIWFEPNWQDARHLARRFPHCLICSIPEESDTSSLRRVPGWRPRRQGGIL